MIVLGLVLVLTPLALWVAWSAKVLFLVLATGVAAAVGLVVCRWFTDDDRLAADGGSTRPQRTGPAPMSNEFLAELSGMAPWTYHNRLTGDARFTAKMARLRKLLGQG